MLLNLSPKHWRDFLKEEAFVVGYQFNDELAEAFARIGSIIDFKKFIVIDDQQAPAGSAESFLTYCAVLGYGRYLSKYYDRGLFMQLRERANDTRPKIREGVVKALTYIGQKNYNDLASYLEDWKNGTPLEQWVCISAICNREFLKETDNLEVALEYLDWITATCIDRSLMNKKFQLLKKELVDAWTRVLILYPTKTKKMVERWIKERHIVIDAIMGEVLQQERLRKLDSGWVDKWLQDLQNHHRE